MSRGGARATATAAAATAAVLALAACGGRNGGGTAGGGPVGNQGEPAAPAFVGSLPVDLVALDMTTLVFVRVAADGVRELRRLEMPDAIEQVAWASPDELYVRLADGGVQVVRGGEAAAVALPPDEAWQVPNPQPGGDLEPLARDELRIDPDGGAWLGRCQWGIPYDAGYCEVWTWARLVPGATVGPRRPRPASPRRGGSVRRRASSCRWCPAAPAIATSRWT